jgi:transposase
MQRLYTEAFIEKVREERAKGELSIEKIAEKFRIGSATVKRWTRPEVYDGPRQRKAAEPEIGEAKKAYKTGRKKIIGEAERAILERIAEKGDKAEILFAKWLRVVAPRNPKITLSTAVAFFDVWRKERGASQGEGLAEDPDQAGEGEVTGDVDGASNDSPNDDGDQGEADNDENVEKDGEDGDADGQEDAGVDVDADDQEEAEA